MPLMSVKYSQLILLAFKLSNSSHITFMLQITILDAATLGSTCRYTVRKPTAGLPRRV